MNTAVPVLVAFLSGAALCAALLAIRRRSAATAGLVTGSRGAMTRDESQLQAVLASMTEGVIATDEGQRVVLVNAAAEQLLAFRGGQAIGRALWDAVPSDAVQRAASRAMLTGDADAHQVSPGDGRRLEITARKFRSADPRAGLVIVVRDVTETYRYEQLRREFVANVSHELRTPLAVISGYVETLRDGAMNDPRRAEAYLATIARHASQLSNVVNDLLDLSRLDASAVPPDAEPTSVERIIRQATDLLAPAAELKHQTFSASVAHGLPPVSGNADYIARAVCNLIDNAIKYTPEYGTVRVSATADGGDAVIEVSDNGIGIPPQDLPRIFERFYRVDRSRSRDMGGTGLGLSIVKHVAQSHGGSIDVASDVGSGSKFTLRLPTAAAGG